MVPGVGCLRSGDGGGGRGLGGGEKIRPAGAGVRRTAENAGEGGGQRERRRGAAGLSGPRFRRLTEAMMAYQRCHVAARHLRNLNTGAEGGSSLMRIQVITFSSHP